MTGVPNFSVPAVAIIDGANPEPSFVPEGNRRILVVDGNPAVHDDYKRILIDSPLGPDARAAGLQSHLHHPFEVDFVFQGASALELVTGAQQADRHYAVAFLDGGISEGGDGVETALQLWLADPELLIVICSEHSEYSWSELVERLGANDRWLILKKPFDSVEVRQLALALTHKWESTRENRAYALSLESMVHQRTEALKLEMAKLREAQKSVSYLAQHDTLTALPNRRFLEAHLIYQVQQAKRYKRGLAVISADLDRFKWINDTLGHAAGDVVLKTVAERLTACLRQSDCIARSDVGGLEGSDTGTVARLGGDEFIVVLTDMKLPEDVAMVARRINDIMSLPIVVEGREIAVGASLGIAMQPADGNDPDTLLRKADKAMYHAKTSGSNNFRFYTDELHRGVDNRLWLENEMKKALEQKAFTLAFQPEIDTAKGVVIGAEALLRWHHPERGVIPPSDFILVAEETGLIVPLGAWAMEEACNHAVIAMKQVSTFERIAVNISARQLRDDMFIHVVQHVLHTSGLPAQNLELEITESSLVDERDEVDRNIRAVREMGVHVALDDFGTGYSSLAHLTRWPIDTVKIDQSFVRDLPGNTRSLGIVRAIMALARCFAERVVAEGIERGEQRDALRLEGCQVMQGFMFCKPVEFSEFVRWSNQARDNMALNAGSDGAGANAAEGSRQHMTHGGV